MKRTYIHNALLVNEGKVFQGGVVICNDTIEQVLQSPSLPNYSCDIVIDAAGAYLIPGVIDEHVHFREPGMTDKGDIYSESKAAAAGGVTSIMDMPNTNPQTTTFQAFEDKMKLMAQKCLVNYSCYFGATNDNIELLQDLDPHRVCGVKVFMGASTGNMLVNDKRALHDIFSIKNILIATHCEDQAVVNENIEKYSSKMVDGDLPVAYHNKIRSTSACFRSASTAYRLAQRLGTQLHILHVSTMQELRLFSNKKDKHITGEVCVGYLNFTSSDYKKMGALIKVNPAIKTPNNRDELYRAINEGRIETIATDHAPHLLSDKQGGALKAKSGMPSIQFALISMLELVSKQVFTITTVVDKMCHAPARLFRIHQRGFIREGYKADLVLVRDNITPYTISNCDVISKCGWTPFAGFDSHWKIDYTIVNGNIIYNGSRVIDSCRGEELSFR
ncbi:MAG: dihydroorotase [Bacteroidales bacterium]|nr:dihydroorotase [Bacteroidales bacterium]